MSTRSIAAASAIAAALALVAGGAEAQDKTKNEKCYGIVKAGKNDCQTANSSCAGTAKKDKQADAWVYVPQGLCERLAGGSLAPGKS